MNAIKGDDAQTVLVHMRKQATDPLIQERDEGFASRDAIIAEQRKSLEKHEFTSPMTRALMKHCGGMDNEITLDMALGQATRFWKTGEDGNRIADPNGPTNGLHPTEDKPIDHEGVAIWLEANVPAFKLGSSKSPDGGDGDVTKRAAPEGSTTERLKKAKSEVEKEAIRAEARKQSRAARSR